MILLMEAMQVAETKTLKTRIILRNDTTANWLTNSTQVLLKGEVGFEFLENGRVKFKIGDGLKTWAQLDYVTEELLINENTLTFDADGKLDLYGFGAAESGAQLVKSADGKLSWIVPDTTTVEGLQTAVETLQETVGDAEGGLVKDVADLKTSIEEEGGISDVVGDENGGLVKDVADIMASLGVPAEGETPATGVYAELEKKANAEEVYTKEEVYDKTEIDSLLSSVYNYKGTKPTYADLPVDGNAVGDVWNVEVADPAHGIKAGDNVAWNGNSWDVLAGVVDLSGYTQNVAFEPVKKVVESLPSSLLSAVSELTKTTDTNVLKFVKFIANEDGTFTLATEETNFTLAAASETEAGLLSAADKAKLDAIEADADVNLIEAITINGQALEIANKVVDLPLASGTVIGLVKGSDAENQISVNEEGIMEVNSLNVNKLAQTDGDTLILDGGNSALK